MMSTSMTSSPCTSTSWGRKESPIQTSSLFKSRTKMNTKILVTEISKKSKNQSIEPLKKSKQASDSMMAQPLYARTWHSTATRKVLSPLENKRPENSPLNTKIQPSVKTSGKLHSSVKSETVKTISQSTKSKSLLLQTPSKDSKPSLLSSSLSTTPLLNSQLSTPKPRSQVSAIKAVETPTVRAYEHYLEAKTPTHRSRPIDEDVADQMARLALNCGPKKTPVQLEQRVLARLMSSGKKSRSKTDVFRVEKARSSLLNSPLTWHANKKSDRRRHADRFIPNRHSMDVQNAQFHVTRTKSMEENTTSTFTLDPKVIQETLDASGLAYQYELAKTCGLALEKRVLNFQAEHTGSSVHSNKEDTVRSKYTRPLKQTKRKIPMVPERILDAPGLVDDYYLNLLDWSSSNLLAVGLGSAVYLWNGSTGQVEELCSFEDEQEPVTSVSWCQDGTHLAIADSYGSTQIWDVESRSRLRTLRDSAQRIGSLAWNRHVLSTGTRDGSIHHHDVRIAHSRIMDLKGHDSDICGLKWSPDGAQLASGGNDNLVNIWDARTTAAKFTKTDHRAAVKALAWCPWQSQLLATGGGSEDRSICFWNTSSGARLQRMDTGSQVTGLLWSKRYRELVSSHGFTDNQLMVWKYPTMQKVVEIPGAHASRILHLAMSPDGQSICTGAADENLKFWKLFSVDEKYLKKKVSTRDVQSQHQDKSPGFASLR